MMPQYDNNLSGALFKNDKKGNDTWPDYRGSAEINGVQYWISSWIKTSKNGEKFMSLKFQPKDDKVKAKSPPTPTEDDFNDDIPF